MHKPFTPLALAASLLLFSPLFFPSLLPAQVAQSASASTGQAPSTTGQPVPGETWNTDQLLTSTVHQAWLLSGKSESAFFDMVIQLAQISAKNRNLQLPDSAAAGRRLGTQIKLAAKADNGQLLYAVVDAAVRKIGTPLPSSGQ